MYKIFVLLNSIYVLQNVWLYIVRLQAILPSSQSQLNLEVDYKYG